MASLIADFVQFASAIDNFLFLEGRLGTRLGYAFNFEIFLKFLFLRSKDLTSLENPESTRQFRLW